MRVSLPKTTLWGTVSRLVVNCGEPVVTLSCFVFQTGGKLALITE